jgi:hypothetical protein
MTRVLALHVDKDKGVWMEWVTAHGWEKAEATADIRATVVRLWQQLSQVDPKDYTAVDPNYVKLTEEFNKVKNLVEQVNSLAETLPEQHENLKKATTSLVTFRNETDQRLWDPTGLANRVQQIEQFIKDTFKRDFIK